MSIDWRAPGEFFEGTHFVLRKPTKPLPERHTVVLVHGIGAFYSCYNYLAEFLMEAGFSTLQYDLVGRGHSEPPTTNQYNQETHIKQLHDLLLHLQGNKRVTAQIHLVGHSMGGSLATIFAAIHPELHLTISLITPAGLLGSFPLDVLKMASPVHSWIKSLIVGRQALLHASNRDFQTAGELKNEFLRDMGLHADCSPHLFDAIWRCLLEFPLTDITEHVKAISEQKHLDVLIIWAEDDQMIPISSNLPRWERILSLGSCGLKVSILDKCGHMLVMEKYVEVGDAIVQHIMEKTYRVDEDQVVPQVGAF